MSKKPPGHRRHKHAPRRVSTPRRAGYYVSPELIEAIKEGELEHKHLDQFVQQHHALRRGQAQTTDFKLPGVTEYIVVTTDPEGRTTIMLSYEWEERTKTPSSRRRN